MKNIHLFFFLLIFCLSFSNGCVPATTQANDEIPAIDIKETYIKHPIEEDDLINLLEFINLRYNKINSFSGNPGLKDFYYKLQKLENGEDVQINVAHFGGSHVQAGQLTSALRQRFDHFTTNSRGSRGFVFPSRLVKSNGPDYTKINFSELWKPCKSPSNNHNCDWGMAGQSATSNSDINSIKTWAFDMDSVLYPFHAVRIYRKDQAQAFEIVVKNGENKMISTPSYVDIYFDQLQDTLDIEVVKKKSGGDSFEMQGFLFGDNSASGITYHDLGVNGAGISSYLKCGLLESQLMDLDLDLVVIGLGLNDTYLPEKMFQVDKLEKDYQLFIDVLKKVNPSVNILMMTNNDHYYRQVSSNKNAFSFNNMIEELAKKNKLSTWDLFNVMGGINSIKKWEEVGFAKPDLIHFTDEGYHLQADLMFEALIKDYSE